MTNGERIDELARALAAPNTRRRAVLTGLGLVGGAGVIAAWRQPASSAQSTCITAGNPCSLGATCCDGTYCASTSLFNPNVGVCTQGSAPESSAPAPTPTRAARVPKTKVPNVLKGMKIRLICGPFEGDENIFGTLIFDSESSSTLTVTQLSIIGNEGLTPAPEEYDTSISLTSSKLVRVFIQSTEGDDPTDAGIVWPIETTNPFDPPADRENKSGVRIAIAGKVIRKYCEKSSKNTKQKRGKRKGKR